MTMPSACLLSLGDFLQLPASYALHRTYPELLPSLGGMYYDTGKESEKDC